MTFCNILKSTVVSTHKEVSGRIRDTSRKEGGINDISEKNMLDFCKPKHQLPHQIPLPVPNYQDTVCQDSLQRLQLSTQNHCRTNPSKGLLHTNISFTRHLLSLTLHSLLLLGYTSSHHFFFKFSLFFPRKVEKCYF